MLDLGKGPEFKIIQTNIFQKAPQQCFAPHVGSISPVEVYSVNWEKMLVLMEETHMEDLFFGRQQKQCKRIDS